MLLSRAKKYQVFLMLSLVSLAFSGRALAIDFIQGQAEAMSGNLWLSSPSPTMLLSLPGSPLARPGWVVESGYARQYGLAELDEYFVAGSYRFGRISGTGGVASFGKSNLYSELTGKISLAYNFDSLAVGLSMAGRLLQFGYEYEDLSAMSVGLGLSYRQQSFLLAATADDLNSPEFHPNSLPLRPQYSLFGEYRGKRSYSVFGRLTATENYDTQIAFGQRIKLASNGAFLWSVQTKPLRYGGGIELKLFRSILAYSFSIHPVLGYSHSISIISGSLTKRVLGVGDEFE